MTRCAMLVAVALITASRVQAEVMIFRPAEPSSWEIRPLPASAAPAGARPSLDVTARSATTFHARQPQAQTGTVLGQVRDASTGEPVRAADVVIEGTQFSALTDDSGQYRILEVPAGTYTISAGRIGYGRQAQEVTVVADQEVTLDFSLEVSVSQLDQIVVTGYGDVQTAETSTGAASAISGEPVARMPAPNVSQALGGRVPGLLMVNTSGEPGADEAMLRIRGHHTLGNNEPLIVIDGVPNRAGGLDRLNPNDIANITVLKDATAAIYGAQAGNGVILVTTKRGRAGDPQINVEFNQGFVQPTRMPKMADAATYLRMVNEINLYRENPLPYSEEEIQRYENLDQQDPWLYRNTDWADAAIRNTSLRTRTNASVTGGSDNILYRVSFGAQSEEGILVNSSTRYNQYNFRTNIDGQISDNISLLLDVAGRWEDRNYPTQTANETFENIVQSFPTLPAYWPNGMPGPAIETGQNPVIMGTDATGFEADDRYFLQTNVQLQVDVPWVEGLSVRGTGVFDKTFRELKSWATPWELCSLDADTYRQQGGDPAQFLSCGPQGIDDPELTQRSEDGRNVQLNLVGEYGRNSGDHAYQVLLGAEYQNFEQAFFESFRTHFISERIPEFFAGGDLEQQIDGSASEGARLNFFGRLNYSYRDKYLFEFTGRYDGSYIFPEDKRFGFFPSISAGWRLGQEEFFRNSVGFFDALKLRASWGQTGNDRVDPYQHLANFEVGPTHVFGINTEVPTLVPAEVPNPNITWEVANQLDIGVEGEVLDHRLAFTFDYFDYLRKDILAFRNASIPRTSGLELPRENIGEVKSWGFDGSLSWRHRISDDWYYDVSLVGGYATNEIQFWDEPPGAPEWQRSTGAKMACTDPLEDCSAETGLFYRAIGVFATQDDVDNYPSWPGARPGDLIFEDVNGDGAITDEDRVRIDRNTIPDWTGGLNLGVRFRQFELSAFLQGATGASAYVRTASGQFGNYYAEFAERRWTPENPNAEGPRAFNRQEEYWMEHDNTYFFRETDYVRLKQLELGYNLTPSFADRLGLTHARIYASAFNLATWTGFEVGDPEAAGDERGGTYPQKRILNLGFNVTF